MTKTWYALVGTTADGDRVIVDQVKAENQTQAFSMLAGTSAIIGLAETAEDMLKIAIQEPALAYELVQEILPAVICDYVDYSTMQAARRAFLACIMPDDYCVDRELKIVKVYRERRFKYFATLGLYYRITSAKVRQNVFCQKVEDYLYGWYFELP